MAKKKTSSETVPVNRAVAAAAERATGASYAQRYEFDFDSGQVVPRDSSTPKALKHVQFSRDGNKLSAYIPALASGRVGTVPTFGVEDYRVDTIADWNATRFGNDDKQNLRKAIYWYKRDPLVKKCVSLLSQLANTRLIITCPDESFRNILEMWFEKAMPNSFRKSWFTERYKTEMVPVIKTLIPYVPSDYQPGQVPQLTDGNVEPKQLTRANNEKTNEIITRNQTNLDEFNKAFKTYTDMLEQNAKGVGRCSAKRLEVYAKSMAAAQYTWMKGHIAAAFAVLDPLAVDIEGPAELPWLRSPYLRISQELRDAIGKPTEQQNEILSHLPIEIIQQIKRGKDKVWLSPNICSVSFGSKQDYERYPYPTICHTIEALEMKYELVAMDRATTRSLKNRILKVTIGNDEYPAFDTAEIEALRQTFNNPSRNMAIFFNHTLQIEWIEPKNTLLQDEKKYRHWNNEIRTAFGISEVFSGTSDKTGSIGNSMLNMKGVEEAVGEGQDDFLDWAREEVELFKQALGVKHQVTLAFDRSNMRDEERWLALLLQYVQNGLLDPQTAIETARFHFPTIKARLEQAIKDRKNGLFLPMPSANNMGPNSGLLSPSGKGRPSESPLAKNNSNRAGTSQPKKAKAKLLADERGIGAYLVLDQEVTEEDRTIAAETFGLPNELVITQQEYEKRTGKPVDWLPPLPTLALAESLEALEYGRTIAGTITKEAEAELEQIKAKSKSTDPNRRGKYVTERVTAEVYSRVAAAWLSKIRPQGIRDEEWNARMEIALAELTPKAKDLKLDEHDVPIYAATVITKQYLKREGGQGENFISRPKS